MNWRHQDLCYSAHHGHWRLQDPFTVPTLGTGDTRTHLQCTPRTLETPGFEMSNKKYCDHLVELYKEKPYVLSGNLFGGMSYICLLEPRCGHLGIRHGASRFAVCPSGFLSCSGVNFPWCPSTHPHCNRKVYPVPECVGSTQ